MLSLIGLLLSNVRFCREKICSRIIFEFRKMGLPGLVFALCFPFVSLPAFAESTGNKYLYYSPGTCASICRLSIILIELIVLGINCQFIMSDMRVIRWFEKKKKRRL